MTRRSYGATTLTIGGGDEVVLAGPGGQHAFDAMHWPTLDGRVVGTLRHQVEQWMAAIRGDDRVPATVADGLAAARVAFAIEDSLRTGFPVEVTA